MPNLLDKKGIPSRQHRDFLGRKAPPEGLGDREQPLVRRLLEFANNLVVRPWARLQADSIDFERPDRLQEGFLERAPDGHDLPRAFHRGPNPAVYGRELVERPPRDLRDDVVQGRLERGQRLAGHGIGNLVEPQTDRNLRGDPGDRITGRLRRKSGRPRNPRVDLDDPILAGLRVDRELDVAAPFHAEGPDDPERGGSQRLVVGVAERLGRRDDDRFARVDPHRIEVFHTADRDAVVRSVPHDLVLEFLPAEDGLLDEDLLDP